jgi:hypothetical protein
MMIRWLALALLLIGWAGGSDAAQTPVCGFTDAVSFPVDPAVFAIVQGYGAASFRHQGRYHTGEDWARRDDPASTYGEFVRAVGDGRVMFASPNGWGADGGVIILEHTFRDGSVFYSMYGHVTNATGVGFPAVYACVRRGDVIAAVGDSRPAPHLHLEIRVNNPTTPGAGYVWDNPTRLGYRRPTKFILNWGAWLLDAYRWRLDLGDETGPAVTPILLDDSSLITVDRQRLLRIHANGGALWRVNLAQPPLALARDGAGALLISADGGVVRYGNDGTPSERWEIGAPLQRALSADGGLLLYTADGAWLHYDLNQRAVRWRIDRMPPPADWVVSPSGALVRTIDQQIITVDAAGAVLDRAQLLEAAGLALDRDGVPLVYARGGLWRVENGVWSAALPFAPAGGERAAVHADADGYTLFDGERMLRYGRSGAGIWQAILTPTAGAARLQRYDSFYLLTSSGGDLAVVRAVDGALCRQMRVFGDARSRMWAGLGADGGLRIHAADQAAAFDWGRLLGACRG